MLRSWTVCLALVAAGSAQRDPPAWTRLIAPFHVVGPIDDVGAEGLAACLIRTRGDDLAGRLLGGAAAFVDPALLPALVA